MKMLPVLCLVAATVVPPSLLRNDAPALEVRSSVTPVTRDPVQLLRRARPGMYRCSVLVREAPDSKLVMTTEDIVIGPGESDVKTRDFGPLRLEYRASVSRSAERADTRVTVTRDGKIVTRHASTVWLERSGIQPVE